MPHSLRDTRHMRYETLYIMLLIFASAPGGDTPGHCTGLIRIVMTEDPITDLSIGRVGGSPDQLLCSHRPWC